MSLTRSLSLALASYRGRSAAPKLVLRAAGRTTQGRRDGNEDAFVVRPSLGLFAVADGMGGYEGGEIASHATIAAVTDLYTQHLDDEDCTWPHVPDHALSLDAQRAILATELAHRKVRSLRTPELAQMGSTLVLLAIRDHKLVVAHVGDSRAYLLRDGRLLALTRDDSLLAELEARHPAMSADERERWASQIGNVVTKAIGHGGADVTPTVREIPLEPGDVLLACTDGLHGVVPDDAIASMLATAPPAQACGELLAAALEHGSRDNVTAIVVRVIAA
jgi:serine/threonine protein phosphatase PrpC